MQHHFGSIVLAADAYREELQKRTMRSRSMSAPETEPR